MLQNAREKDCIIDTYEGLPCANLSYNTTVMKGRLGMKYTMKLEGNIKMTVYKALLLAPFVKNDAAWRLL